jgi:hypothetical protein
MGNIEKFLDGSGNGKLEKSTSNRYAAYLMAAKEMINSPDGANFKISSDTMKVFNALGMGDSDVTMVAQKLKDIKDFFRGIKDGFSDIIWAVKKVLPSSGLLAEMFGVSDDPYGSSKALTRAIGGLTGLGIAFAIMMSPIARLVAAFFMFEGLLRLVGLRAEGVFDAMSIGIGVLLYKLHPVLAVIFAIDTILRKIDKVSGYLSSDEKMQNFAETSAANALANIKAGKAQAVEDSTYGLRRPKNQTRMDSLYSSNFIQTHKDPAYAERMDRITDSVATQQNITIQIGDKQFMNFLVPLMKQYQRKEEE